MEQLIERLDHRERVRLQKEAEQRRKESGTDNGHNHNHGQNSVGMNSVSGMMGGGAATGSTSSGMRQRTSAGGR